MKGASQKKTVSKEGSLVSERKESPTEGAASGEPICGRFGPVVGIGAAAGGLEAFTRLVGEVPADTGMVFVLIQHLDRKHRSELRRLIAKVSKMPVREATDGQVLLPNEVYVVPPGVTPLWEAGVMRLLPREADAAAGFLPVDAFFGSLAADGMMLAVGVVLSGCGSDGAQGVAEIKARGGYAFAQDELSAKYPEMPRHAARHHGVDWVGTPEEIAQHLVRLSKRAEEAVDGVGEAELQTVAVTPQERRAYERVLELLRAATGVDFSDYRDNTIRRRIERRMALNRVTTLREYAGVLAGSAQEVGALHRDILINVTRFFRDAEVFEALKTTVFPEILKRKSGDMPLRIWVPGCSTGQEVYSIAMVLLEFLDGVSRRVSVQIFGTDLSESASVDRARVGLYGESIAEEVSSERLARFFTREERGYRISRQVRDICVFAKQNVAVDPPFSQVDLISCRNLLIYLAGVLQKRVIPSFHYALNAGGFLVLGASETVGRFTDLFQLVDTRNRIYAKLPALVRAYPHFAHFTPAPPSLETIPIREKVPSMLDLQKEADRVLIHRYAPAGVLVSEELEVLQFRGRTGMYLEPAPGEASFHVLRMARESLFSPLRLAIEEARKSGKAVRREGIRLREVDRYQEVNLEVIPVRLAEAVGGGFLILFESVPQAEEVAWSVREPAGAAALELSSGELAEIEMLRQDLANTKEYLQSIIEQKAATNEELRCANEETISANEELQSANEELQTAKEELQSTNEELTTVNEELQNRNLELVRANDDLQNLIGSVKIPIVIFGTDLRVRRFTPMATSVLGLTQEDVGRSISSIRLPLEIPQLEGLLRDSMANVGVHECEVKDQEGHWYVLRIHPYRTADHRIDGAVAVWMDITERRLAEMLQVAQLNEISAANAAKDRFLAALSHELRTPLTPVLLAVSGLEGREDLAEEVRQELAMIRRNVGVEAALIDDLLDLSRVAQGKFSVNMVSSLVVPLLSKAIAVVEETARVKGVRVELRAGTEEEGCHLMVDPIRIRQVFSNLLRNAIKFTPAGGTVLVLLWRERPGMLRLEIADTGIGIPEQELSSIFNPFQQGAEAITRGSGGLGLGLALAKAIVELHGGRIFAESAGEGCGAKFVVELPTTDPGFGGVWGMSLPLKVGGAKWRLLVVEDHADTGRVLRSLLQRMGCEVVLAQSMVEAKQAAAAGAFDVVVSDLGLPDGNGLDLFRELHGSYGFPGIALSGYATELDRQQVLAAGFSEFLMKPIDFGVLQAAIARQVRGTLRGAQRGVQGEDESPNRAGEGEEEPH